MNSQNKISQSQKLMVFVLSMSLYGLATLFTELIPSFQVGIVEFSVEYFLFIPLTLAMLFDPLSAGLGAATGELDGRRKEKDMDMSPGDRAGRSGGRSVLLSERAGCAGQRRLSDPRVIQHLRSGGSRR